jgi:quaternary ammonium compound-resistance protein SugE
MAWMTLLLAGLLEVAWAYFMKQSAGFTRFAPTLATLVAMLASFLLLAHAMKTLPLGTAYPIWTGIGALGTFLVGIIMLGEPATLMRLAAAGLILGGLILMKIAS